MLWVFAAPAVKLMKTFSWFAGAFSIWMCFLKLQRIELSRPPYTLIISPLTIHLNNLCCYDMNVILDPQNIGVDITNSLLSCLVWYDTKYIIWLWRKLKWLPWPPQGVFAMAPFLKKRFRATNYTSVPSFTLLLKSIFFHIFISSPKVQGIIWFT